MTNQEVLKLKIEKPRTCLHEDKTYSLRLSFRNAHMNTGTFHFDNGGNAAEVIVFDMTRQDMFELANKILEVAGKLPVEP